MSQEWAEHHEELVDWLVGMSRPPHRALILVGNMGFYWARGRAVR